MRFGRVAVADAVGAICAHTLRIGPGIVFKKGRCLSASDVATLQQYGHRDVIAAQLDAGDVVEDVAARRVAEACSGAGLRVGDASTGRCNLYAEQPGLLCVDRDRIDALNSLSEAVTLATVAPYTPLPAGGLAATIKIIPFAAAADVLDRWGQGAAGGVVQVAAFQPARVQVGLILTRLASVPESLLDRAAGAQRVRANRLGGQVVRELRCPHDAHAVAEALRTLLPRATDRDAHDDGPTCSMIWLLGSSAIVDRQDVIPSAIQQVGGRVEHLGMPVDPGNLLLLAEHTTGPRQIPILGVPGCARSLRRSGFDWVLERLAAGLCVTSRDVMAMGVGGLLSESPLRPQPRTTALAEPQVAAIVLCAGQSRRMGATNKLLLPIDNRPLIAHTVDALLSTAVRPIILVTGHDSDAVLTALGDRVHARGVRVVHNTDYAAGMSTSLRIGLNALAQADAEAGRAGTGPCDGALICLGDMPHVRPAHIEGLLAAFDPADGREVIVPMYEGRRGNPVLWAARFFPEMQLLTGDTGARSLLQRHTDVLCAVPMADDGVTVDVDTPEAFQTLQAARMPPDAAS